MSVGRLPLEESKHSLVTVGEGRKELTCIQKPFAVDLEAYCFYICYMQLCNSYKSSEGRVSLFKDK